MTSSLPHLPHDALDQAAKRNPIAALFVAKGGCYFDMPGVDPWDIDRDARSYAGPWPVVAHPPCQRWGRFWHGSTRKPHQFKLGDDRGCFAAALAIVRRFGGVIEHPEGSHAWRHFGLNAPPRDGGWVAADFDGGWTCCVEQGHYGHIACKATWLYACHTDLPSLRWGRGAQRIHPVALARHGYEKARRIGMMAMVGGKDKTRIREATPIEFRDVLISIARTAHDRAFRSAPHGGISPDGACVDDAPPSPSVSRNLSPGAVTERNWLRDSISASLSFPDRQGSVRAHGNTMNRER